MTLAELDAHRYLVTQLNTAKAMLQSLQNVLHAASLDGMPRNHSVGNRMDALVEKLIEQEKMVDRYEKAVKKSEKDIKEFIGSISDSRTNLIFYLRFIAGYQWQDVASIIGGNNSTESVKSQCYRYLRSGK